MVDRILFIVRGLPSAGKTTLAEVIAPDFNYSLDDVRASVGDQHELSSVNYLAERNLERAGVEEWMKQGVTPIAVHDVNAKRNDVNDWLLVAAGYGYQCTVVHIETDLNNADLAARSRTNCPPSAIERFRLRWQAWGA